MNIEDKDTRTRTRFVCLVTSADTNSRECKSAKVPADRSPLSTRKRKIPCRLKPYFLNLLWNELSFLMGFAFSLADALFAAWP